MKNFIFDLYGTLIDIRTDENDSEFRTRAKNNFFALCGGICDFWKRYDELCLSPDGDECYEPDLLKVFAQLATECGGDVSEAELKEYAYNFRQLSRQKLEVYPEVKNILSGLKKRGANVYLLSNAQACFTRRELDETLLSNCFDGILLSSDAGVKKPSERFFNMLIDGYGLDKNESIYIGNDFYADVCGSKNAGLSSVFIDTYDFGIDKACKVADYCVKDFMQLKALLFKLVSAV